MPTASDVEAAAIALAGEGAPYVHNGRSDDGMDCSGVLVVLARRLGVPVVDHPVPYSPQGYSRQLEAALDCQARRAAAPGPGRVGLFWFDRTTREPQHVGVFVRMPATGSLGMVHSWQGVGRVTMHHLNGRWMRRLIRAYDFPAVTIGAGG